MPATVKTLEYDPNRSAFIALVEYTDGVKNYIIAPDGLKVGDVVISGKGADIKPGNCLPSRTSPSVPSSTTSSCIPAAALSWFVPLATWLS